MGAQCHNIDGFEDKKPIGISLNYEGSKLISKLDFGLWHEKIPHTKWDWFYNKIKQPEIFDLIPKPIFLHPVDPEGLINGNPGPHILGKDPEQDENGQGNNRLFKS